MTQLVSRDDAVRLLGEGAVVAVPTDTVYGLAASLVHPDAVASLFLVKGRPSGVPLPVLVHALSPMQEIDVEWGERAQRLSEEFWPGPLTIVVAASHELSLMLGGARDTVGVRVPDDELLLSVLRECGPLAVSSANTHGAEPCHSAHEVLEALAGEHLAGVLNGGERRGEVSTVVEVDDTSWRVLREGAVSSARIAAALD
ncbi:MAG: L-threonylcarbamoyladenylate synthase [Acidimicrobiales bacterium]|jgi:tRNA threonylcarbamoyl adenosine modification protein (Sua5/YciO/YrdC/YwlC family)